MKKTLLFTTLMAAALVFTGCQNASDTVDSEKIEKTDNSSTEINENAYNIAPQHPVLPENKGNIEDFPFEMGKEYLAYLNNNEYNTVCYKFNSDGTLEYYKKGGSNINDGYIYKYTVDTDAKCFYCYIDKNLDCESVTDTVHFDDYITYEEQINEYKRIYNEDYYRNQALRSKFFFEYDIYSDYLMETYGDYNDELWFDHLNEKDQIVTDEAVINYFLYRYSGKKDFTLSDMVKKWETISEKALYNKYKVVYKFSYEITEDGVNVYPVVYENDSFEEIIYKTDSGLFEFNSEEELNELINKIEITNNSFHIILRECRSIAGFTILNMKDGKIYTDEIGISALQKKGGHKSKLDPIPYKVEGKGPDMKVTITYEGENYILTPNVYEFQNVYNFIF